MENALILRLGNSEIRISPMELEIAYELYLGSDKDFEDAEHLYITFMEMLDVDMLRDFIKKLCIKMSVAKKVLDDDL